MEPSLAIIIYVFLGDLFCLLSAIIFEYHNKLDMREDTVFQKRVILAMLFFWPILIWPTLIFLLALRDDRR